MGDYGVNFALVCAGPKFILIYLAWIIMLIIYTTFFFFAQIIDRLLAPNLNATRELFG
jgi:hypothetical protein